MDVSFQDINLEKGIYHALADLYNSLAFNQEKQNNIEKCNEYLHKKLENLDNEHSIIKRIKESSGSKGDKEILKTENANITDQLEVYLKIAENNFKMKNYTATIKCLNGVIEKCNPGVDPSNVNLIIFGLY
jgi:tRNA/tmRNA/rRNA uracil-C5-methylase (TrmA/RlmC/RlmD family)